MQSFKVYPKINLNTINENNYKEKYKEYFSNFTFFKEKINEYNLDDNNICVLLRGQIFRGDISSKECFPIDFSIDYISENQKKTYYFMSLFGIERSDENIIVYRKMLDNIHDYFQKNFDNNICLVVFINGDYFYEEMYRDGLRNMNRDNLIITNKDILLNDVIQNIRAFLINKSNNSKETLKNLTEIENTFLANYEITNTWNLKKN